MIVEICGKKWDIEEIRKMYENDFDTRKAWCQALGHKQGTHFKQLIKRLGFKEEDFGKNRKNIYKKYIHKDDRFGKLVVIEPDCQKDKYGRQMSLCHCDCGTELIVLDNSLWTQNTTSCGCKTGNDLNNKIKYGDIFGYLTVIDANNYHLGKDNNLASKCRCICGEETIVRNNSLRSGNTTSCGCMAGRTKESRINNGDVFDYLTVIDANNYHLGKDNGLASKCRCICGKEKIIRNNSLRKGDTTSCGCRKISKGEEQIQKFLDRNNIVYKSQYTFQDLKSSSNTLSFDFAVFDNDNKLKFLIEYQGEQHYFPVKIFGGEKAFERQKNNDLRKQQYCLSNNITLIEIPYYDRNILEEKYLQQLLNLNQ